MKKAAAHAAVVTSNWQIAQIALTVAKIPSYDLAEEHYWHLRALWLARLTFKNEKQESAEVWAEGTQYNASALSPE